MIDVAPASMACPSASIPEPYPTQAAEGKGKRKAKDPESPPEEKRAARFKPKCLQNIVDRVQRVWQQRLFIIERNRSGDELRETFSVLGTTGVYRCHRSNATVQLEITEHILFIYLKVLRVPESSLHWYQKALLRPEVEEIFAQAPLAPNCSSSMSGRRIQALGKDLEPPSLSFKKRIQTEGNDCLICYEAMYEVAENALEFCETCGKALYVNA